MQDTQTMEDMTQLLVVKSRMEKHFPMAGHLGQDKTLNHLMAVSTGWVFAVGVSGECQLVNPPPTPKAPLCTLPLIKVPIESIGMDLVRLLEQSVQGHRFVLGLVDYAKCYPKVVPLQHLRTQCCRGTLLCDLPSRDPKGDPD